MQHSLAVRLECSTNTTHLYGSTSLELAPVFCISKVFWLVYAQLNNANIVHEYKFTIEALTMPVAIY